MSIHTIGQDLLLLVYSRWAQKRGIINTVDREETAMDESAKIVFDIITLLYPEWIEKQKNKYCGIEEYDQYKQVILNVFGYDIERATLEQERNVDISDLEKKIKIMKLIAKLRESENKKRGKKK